MKVESTLRKEGIVIVKSLDTLKVNSIAHKISDKLCKAFPEHGLNSNDLFAQIARLNMYTAKFPDNLIGAKYFYKNNSIFFNADFNLSDLSSFAIHECIHYLQEMLDDNGNLVRLGLYDVKNEIGLSINEAAVQMMTAEANRI